MLQADSAPYLKNPDLSTRTLEHDWPRPVESVNDVKGKELLQAMADVRKAALEVGPSACVDGKCNPGAVLSALERLSDEANRVGNHALGDECQSAIGNWLACVVKNQKANHGSKDNPVLLGAAAADIFRGLQHCSAASRSPALKELLQELKRYYRSHSAPDVIMDYADKCVETLIGRCPGIADEQRVSGSQLTDTRTQTLQIGMGDKSLPAKLSVDAVLSYVHAIDLNVDEDRDFNLTDLHGVSIGGKVKFAVLKAVGWNFSQSASANIQHLRGSFIETTSLREAIGISLMQLADSKSMPMHESTAPAKLALKNTIHNAKAGWKELLGMEPGLFPALDRPDYLSADKLAAGSLNQARIRHVAHGMGDESFRSFFRESFELPSEEFGRFKAKVLSNGKCQIRPQGPLAKLPISVPAGASASRRGKASNSPWTQHKGTAEAQSNFNTPGMGLTGGVKLEHTDRKLRLERIKHSHEFLQWDYCGSERKAAGLLAAVHDEMKDKCTDFSGLLKPMLLLSGATEDELCDSLSAHDSASFASSVRQMDSREVIEGMNRSRQAFGLFAERYQNFLSLRDQYVADPTGKGRDALDKLNRMVFDGKFELANRVSDEDAHKFFARIHDAFSVGLGALGHRLSVLKQHAAKLQHDNAEPANDAARNASQVYANLADVLKNSSNHLVPDKLLRFSSIQGTTNSLNRATRLTLSMDGRSPFIEVFKTPGNSTAQDAVSLQTATEGIKFTAGYIKVAQHPNPVRVGRFIDLNLSVGGGAAFHLLLAGAKDIARKMALEVQAKLNKNAPRMDDSSCDAIEKEIEAAIRRAVSAGTATLTNGRTRQIALRFRAPLNDSPFRHSSWTLQRGRLIDSSLATTKLSVPSGATKATMGGAVPVNLSGSTTHETVVNEVDREWKGPDLAYHLLQRTDRNPTGWDKKTGTFNLQKLLAQWSDSPDGKDARYVLNDLGSMIGLLKAYGPEGSYGQRGEFSRFADADADELLMEADLAEPYGARKDEDIVGDKVPAAPQNPRGGKPLKLNGRAWISSEELQRAELSLAEAGTPAQKLEWLKVHWRVLAAYHTLIEHYSRKNDRLKAVRSYKLEVRPDPEARPYKPKTA